MEAKPLLHLEEQVTLSCLGFLLYKLIGVLVHTTCSTLCVVYKYNIKINTIV